jgi:hypothetical protein
VPVETVRGFASRASGIGDVSLEGKYVVASSDRSRWIVSTGLETSFATGSRRWSFGEGTTVFEPFIAAARDWDGIVIQAAAHGDLPLNPVPGEPIHRFAYSVAAMRVLAETSPWTIGVEVDGKGLGVGVTPQIQRRLTPSGALTAAFGVRLPIKPTPPDSTDLTRWVGSLLWDYREPLRPAR